MRRKTEKSLTKDEPRTAYKTVRVFFLYTLARGVWRAENAAPYKILKSVTFLLDTIQ